VQNPDPVTDQPLHLHRSLDVAAAARVFRERRRVRITDVLEPASAERLHACLAQEVPWRLTYNEGTQNVVVDAATLRGLGDRKRQELVQGVLTRAQDKFQYLFCTYPMVTAYLKGEDPELFLHSVFEWLNDSRTLDVLRQITGIDTIRKADAQATLYQPGHFLKQHDDTNRSAERRRVAYVLQLTRRWRADWGGHLHFLNADGDIGETWMPQWNSLSLFEVPVPHVVGYVAPFATQPRYAITGWLCDA
jgi:Rps23 Pro-64 3,4-dihydroxylase Tpa1-like proline 4-hydroxylase